MTPVQKTQIYFREEELQALHGVARRARRSVAGLVREAVQRVWLRPTPDGPVGVWDGEPSATSVDHDRIYDEPA
jgi:hypothetical protein